MALNRFGALLPTRSLRQRRSAAVPGSGVRVHRVPVGQQWDNVTPRVSGHENAVQQYHGRGVGSHERV